MKYMSILAVILVSACSAQSVGTNNIDAELDFQAHQQYLESVYNLDNYDPEYVADCLYYEEFVCEFE